MEDNRRTVRLRALKVLSEVTLANLVLHEERLLESCVLPHFANLEEEKDRKAAPKLECGGSLRGRARDGVGRHATQLPTAEREAAGERAAGDRRRGN